MPGGISNGNGPRNGAPKLATQMCGGQYMAVAPLYQTNPPGKVAVTRPPTKVPKELSPALGMFGKTICASTSSYGKSEAKEKSIATATIERTTLTLRF